jgi:hypothetical protein
MPKRRWLRYRIRTLHISILVAAACLSYYVNWAQRRRAAMHKFETRSITAWKQSLLPWHVRPLYWFGYGCSVQIRVRRPVTDSELSELQRLYPEAVVVEDTMSIPRSVPKSSPGDQADSYDK